MGLSAGPMCPCRAPSFDARLPLTPTGVRLDFLSLGADPFDEGIGVKAGFTDQRQNTSGPGVDGHHGAAPTGQGRRGIALQADIQVQRRSLPGTGGSLSRVRRTRPLALTSTWR